MSILTTNKTILTNHLVHTRNQFNVSIFMALITIIDIFYE